MTHSPLAIKRRHVLGDLYSKCDAVEQIPVYLESPDGELIGHVDEGLGHYADAYQFHIPEDVCKKLATGHYTYSFDYDYTDPDFEVIDDHVNRIGANIDITFLPGLRLTLMTRATFVPGAEVPSVDILAFIRAWVF